ncbi:uncharacterized protein [Dysidea avara]|uniref:uncharacterized protein n=1 Tax=Dysidea avara TaxID=196820 RepID=UPI00333397F7
MDQLRKRLKRMGLRRRDKNGQISFEEVEAAIKKEREVSGNCIGYRLLHKKLKEKHSLRVGRTVGPDYIWHCDGYDKLKPYGFAIHGCIDGYSRRILWLHVSPSNNDPYIIAGYYLNCVEKLAGCPTILRTDRGTENTNIAFLRDQHDDPFAKEKSFMYGRSTSNQHIEAWWGQLRKNAAQWWMDYFKALRESGELDDSSEYHIDCLRYCFMDLIQAELDYVAHEWNIHRIRPSNYNPGGIPDKLYFLPEDEGTRSYRHTVSSDDVESAREWSVTKPCSVPKEFTDLAEHVMSEDNISKPTNADEAIVLYKHLKSVLSC